MTHEEFEALVSQVLERMPILAHFSVNPGAVKAQVRETVLHEIGHHFGMSEQEIHRAQDGTISTGFTDL